MSVLLILGALSLPVLCAPSATLELGARTELRLRRPGDPDVVTSQFTSESVDFDGTADAGLRLRWHRTQLAFGYSPRFTLRNFLRAPERDLLNAGVLSFEWRDRRVALALTERGSYGDRSLTTLVSPDVPVSTAGPPLQAVPGLQTVKSLQSETAGTAGFRVARRSDIGWEVGYRIEGGADRVSRKGLPLVHAQTAATAWRYRLTRTDTVTTRAAAAWVETGGAADRPDTRARVVSAAESWGRRWGRSTDTELAAGIVWAETSSRTERSVPYPLASVLLTHTLFKNSPRERLDLRANADLNVVVDRLLGSADHRLQGGLRLDLTLGRTLIYANGLHAESLPPASPAAIQLSAADVGVRHELVKELAIEAGARTFQQRFLSGGTQFAGVQWAAFTALIFRARPTRL